MSDTLKSCNFMEYEGLRVVQLDKKFFFLWNRMVDGRIDKGLPLSSIRTI